MLGLLFTVKLIVLIGIILFAVFVYRAFCRFVCPLGAIYGLFNRFSLLGVKVETSKCTSCGRCVHTCKMDVAHVGDRECIQCGECVRQCPEKAIRFKAGKWTLMGPEIKTDEEKIQKA